MTRGKAFVSSDLVPGVGGVKHIENNLGVLTVSRDFMIRRRDGNENVGIGINFASASHFFLHFFAVFERLRCEIV